MNPNTTENLDEDSDVSVAALLAAGKERVCAAGETLYFQGDDFAALTYILSGEAKLVSLSEAGDALRIGHAHPGHFLGESAFFSGRPQAYEVTSVTPMKIVTIHKHALTEILHREPSLNAIIARSLATKFDRFVQHYSESNTLSVRGQICAELARLAIPNGLDPRQHIIRPIPVFSKLAEQLGTSRETVSRTVSTLQQVGVLRRAPGAIIIERLSELKASIA